jgi:hypothetical protein
LYGYPQDCKHWACGWDKKRQSAGQLLASSFEPAGWSDGNLPSPISRSLDKSLANATDRREGTCVCMCVIATDLREGTEDQDHRADEGLGGERGCSQGGDCHHKHGVEPGRNRLLDNKDGQGGAYDAEKVAGRSDELRVGVSECV